MTEKLDLNSLNITEERKAQLKQIFPEIFTENKVDFEKLKMALGDEIEESPERYEMNWAGKKEAFKQVQIPSIGTLRPCKEESVNFDETENLYIEGDNLEVLKLLQKSYYGKIKMIYIDPPYNTGKDFVYKDNFKDNLQNYLEITGQVDGEGKRISANQETAGRYHSNWLNMMYPRLFLARNLLKEDGVIFISIDDNEVHNLRKICDEIFGEENFIEQFNWVKTETPANLSKKSKKMIEYILCYQKLKNDKKFKGLKKEGSSSNGLLNQTNKLTRLKFPANLVRTNISNKVLRKGVYQTDKYEIELINDVEVYNGIFVNSFELIGKFKWTQPKLDEEIKNGTEILIPTEKLSPAYNKQNYEEEVPPNIINRNYGVGTNENAGTYLERLMGRKVFDFPKPVELIHYLINFDLEENDIVLDFFSGSGTTAEAVYNYNLKQNKNLKYIVVQLPEKIDINNATNINEAKKIENTIEFLNSIKKPLNICEIGKERIRRAGAKINEELKSKNMQLKLGEETKNIKLDTGFKVLKLDTSNFKEWDNKPQNLFEQLEKLKENTKAGRTQDDILYEIILKSGLSLSEKIDTKELNGKKIFAIMNGFLIICLEKELTLDFIRAIAELKPAKVVFLDIGFQNNDQLKTNAVQIMKSIKYDGENSIEFKTV